MPRSPSSFWIEPRLRGHELGSHEWFRAQREVLREKAAVRASYMRWYEEQLEDLRSTSGDGAGTRVLELGSGSGFLREVLPEVITSDFVEGVADYVIDARDLPFATGSIRGIVMSHVFHHIPDVRKFFR